MLALPSVASLCFFRTMALNIEGWGGGGQDDPVMGNLLLPSKDEIAILERLCRIRKIYLLVVNVFYNLLKTFGTYPW